LRGPTLDILEVGEYSQANVLNAIAALRDSRLDLIVHNASLFEEDASDPQEAVAQLERLMAIHVSLPMLINTHLESALKLAPEVRVNTIQPGALMFLPEHDDTAKGQVLEQSLLKIESGFRPVLQTIDFFIDNPFITGTAVKVDGGRAICR
jgi:dihydromonapterin reductase/dihydrofolate reductase